MARKHNYKFAKIKNVILFIWEYKCYVCKHQDTSNHVHHFNENAEDNSPFNFLVLCQVHHKLIHKNARIKKIEYPSDVFNNLVLLSELWSISSKV